MLNWICEIFVTGCCSVCVLAAYAFVAWQVYDTVRACIVHGWRNVHVNKGMLLLVVAALVFFLFGVWYLIIGWNVAIG